MLSHGQAKAFYDRFGKKQDWQSCYEDAAIAALMRNTIMRGGDADTNGVISGALLGAVYGRNAVPDQWVECLLNCRPAAGLPHIRHPRPECFWPVDALDLAESLVSAQRPMG